ncbi:MAG TPA: DsbA family protein [Gemmatimonadaceae bacterium]|nr:DsbA family protein [Gemmatimonadaceae bacterium]
MANKNANAGKGRKPGVVKASKKSATSNRAFYLILTAIAVVGVAALAYVSTRPKDVVVANTIDSTLPPVQSSGYVVGNPAATLEVTEFGDFECPACGRFAVLTEPDIRKNLVETGKIRWRFIDYPLSMHKNTWQASRAAACADEQGKFWAFHDALYSTQDEWSGEVTNNPDKFMKQLGQRVGLNTSQFNQCVDTKKTQAKVQAHLKLAEARQVSQTPTFVIGDKQLAGALTYDQFSKYVDDALANAKPAPKGGGDTTKAAPLTPVKKGE